jgi:hypothetical protein
MHWLLQALVFGLPTVNSLYSVMQISPLFIGQDFSVRDSFASKGVRMVACLPMIPRRDQSWCGPISWPDHYAPQTEHDSVKDQSGHVAFAVSI